MEIRNLCSINAVGEQADIIVDLITITRITDLTN